MFKKDQGKQIVQQHLQSEFLVKRYIKGNLLGKGGFAKCYQFISSQTNLKYAAKIIQKSSLNKPKAKQKLQSQIKIHKSLHNHHIVNFQHFFEDQQYVYILLELCRPETLNDLLKRRKRITEFETKYYIYQITQALMYIHDKKVIHRDLKLGNLFLTDELQIKVGDFGLATKLNFENQKRKTTCGTPNYLAPEILINKNGHSYEVDIWSIGIIAYALLFGRPPFQTNDLKLTYSKIKSCNYSFPDTVDVSSSAKKFITKILQIQPHRRPTLYQIMEDQFITSIQIPKSLPLATISIPPSSNLIKKYEKFPQFVQYQSDSQRNCCQLSGSLHMNSYRSLNKNTIMMSTQKIQPKLSQFDKKFKFVKTQTNKQNLLLQRAASTAGLLQRKKLNDSVKQIVSKNLTLRQQIPCRVLYFEENPKFGLSYMLSSNSFGMRYNDSSCLITNNQLTQIKYLTMQANLKQITSAIYNFSQTPEDLTKKMKIINHYIKQLKKKKKQTEQNMSNQLRIQLQKMKLKQNSQISMKIYVVRSLKTSKAQFFEFSNQYVQIKFEDSSELIFLNPKVNQFSNKQTNIVNYITKFSQLKQFSYFGIQNQSEDIKKRMNYALNVIGRVKKSLDFKQLLSKQNKVLMPYSENQSLQKKKQIIGRSSSTMKIMIESNKQVINKDNIKRFNSTAKLKTVQNLGDYALKQISNRIY